MQRKRQTDVAPETTLTTYASTVLALSTEDADYVQGELGEFVDIRRPASGDGFLLNPGPNVFVIPLPTGHVLRSLPRLPVRNVMRMLHYAYDLPLSTTDYEAPLDSFEAMLEIVVAAFCSRVEQRISAGLYRQYVDVEENLFSIKGKILFAPDFRHNSILRHRTYCNYSDLRWDVPDNQVIKFVARLLAGTDLRDDLRARLRAIDQIMDEVSLVSYSSADVLRFEYHRLNRDYVLIHDLCRMLMDGYSVFEREGAYLFHGFSLNMNDLFEAFVATALAHRLRADYRVARHDQSWLGQRLVHGKLRRALRLEPDITFSRAYGRRAIADCKFKKEPGSGDFYQVLAYCVNRGVNRGALIYPRTEVELPAQAEFDDTQLMPTPVVVRRMTVDLDATDLEAEVDKLAGQVRAWLEAAKASIPQTVAG